MSTLLKQPVFIVEQRQNVLETDTDYDLLDEGGHRIGTVRRVEQSTARKAFRLVSKIDEYLSHRFEVTDREGAVQLRLDRPARFVRSQLVVTEPSGRELGEVTQLNSMGKIRFGLTSDGSPVGELRSRSVRTRSFDILDVKERRVGTVGKEVESLPAIASIKDHYAVALRPDVDGPLRTLAIAAGIGLDLALHHSGE